MRGLVIRSTGSWYEVELEGGRRLSCRLQGKFRIRGLKATNPVAVGDHVRVLEDKEDGTGAITAIEERKNYIIRRSTNLSKNWHILAANIDRAFLVATVAMPRTSSGFIDRFLVTAEAYSIPAALIFNKIDIYDEAARARHDELMAIYSAVGYPCFEVSAREGTNVDALRLELMNKISLFSGHSGVGKSALINRIDPSLELKTGLISEYWQRGQHTTTFAEMLTLASGGYIIDTPGIREFGLLEFGKEELTHYFPELFRLLPDCKYYNCTHVHEPGCAVRDALEEGRVSLERYQNYLRMLEGEDMDTAGWELE